MRAFTLIELLIVVAIIAILAAIAVPNFLEAQVRSKVARVRADLRTLTTGLESYRVDHNAYPDIPRGAPSLDPPAFPTKGSPEYAIRALPRLSTPVAYLTVGILPDPFSRDPGRPSVLGYANLSASEINPELLAIGITSPTAEGFARYRGLGYLLISVGPDGVDYLINSGADPEQGAGRAYIYLAEPNSAGVGSNFVYDPTNGTISVGDVSRTRNGETR